MIEQRTSRRRAALPEALMGWHFSLLKNKPIKKGTLVLAKKGETCHLKNHGSQGESSESQGSPTSIHMVTCSLKIGKINNQGLSRGD